MKTISILKKLINFYFYFLVLVFSALAIIIPIQYSNGIPNNLNLIDDFNLSSLSFWKFFAILLIVLTILYLNIRAVFLLKNCLSNLSNGNYFSKLITTNFKKAGKLFIISGICFSVFKFILRLILLSDIKLGVDNALVVSLIMGLFLMFLSEVFIKARETQQENDLTI